MRTVFSALALLGLASCSPSTGATCPSNPTLTYASFGQGFFGVYCLRCHSETRTGTQRNGAPDGVNFDTVDGIRAKKVLIDQYAGANGDVVNTWMPENDPRPTVEERKQLSEWLACDAP